MTNRRSGVARAAAAVILAITLSVAALLSHGLPPARAAWVGAAPLPTLGSGHVWSVAIAPATPATVAAATDNGVYLSKDGGQTWAASGLQGRRVWTVGFDLRAPNPLLAGLDRDGGLQRSDDGGATWVDASAGLPSRTVRTLATGLSVDVVGTASGVAVSDDGHAWQPAGLTGYDVSAVAISAYSPRLTLIAGVDGVPEGGSGYLFRNAGPTAQWETLNIGAQSAVISALAASPLPAPPGVRALLAATNSGLYRSNDGGTAWQKTFPPTNDLGSGTVTTVAFSPLDPQLAYAGDDAGGNSGGRLVRSTNGGVSFDIADAGLPGDKEVSALAVAPATPPLVVAAVNPPGRAGLVYVETDAGVPAPAPTGPPENGATALPTIGPVPTIAPTPPPAPGPPPESSGGDFVLKRFVDAPLKVVVELLTLVAAAYIFVRLRERRHIEGPP